MIILKRMEYDMDFQDTSKIGARLNIPYGICSRRNIYCIYIHRYYVMYRNCGWDIEFDK